MPGWKQLFLSNFHFYSLFLFFLFFSILQSQKKCIANWKVFWKVLTIRKLCGKIFHLRTWQNENKSEYSLSWETVKKNSTRHILTKGFHEYNLLMNSGIQHIKKPNRYIVTPYTSHTYELDILIFGFSGGWLQAMLILSVLNLKSNSSQLILKHKKNV